MKLAINVFLILVIVFSVIFGFQIYGDAKGALHQVLGSMEMIKALLAGIILAVVNKK